MARNDMMEGRIKRMSIDDLKQDTTDARPLDIKKVKERAYV